MPSTLIVGAGSFLAQQYIESGPHGSFRATSHQEIDAPNLLEGVDLLLNFALDSRYRAQPYDSSFDVDLKLAERIRETEIQYVMLSSRKVYAASAQWDAKESDPMEGIDAYGRNKATTERALSATLPSSRLTILRLGNVIGFEYVPGRRSFMGMALGSLRENGWIAYDMSPFTRRDFITASHFCKVLNACVKERITGVYNVGSGVPLPTGEIAMWVLEGYGQGEFRTTSPRIFDEFVLNVERQTDTFDMRLTRDEIRSYCFDLGERLRHA